MKRLVNRGLGVEGEAGVHFGRDAAGHNLQNLASKDDQQLVEGSVDLVVDGTALGLAVRGGFVNQLGILWEFAGGEDQAWVRRGILGLVLVDGGKVARVADDRL